MKIRKLLYSFILLVVVTLVSGCQNSNEQTSVRSESEPADRAGEMTLSSDAFEDKGEIPALYANTGVENGQNISVPLAWAKAPEDTKSFALIMLDKAASNFVHWMVIDIPAATQSLPAGASGTDRMPDGSRELTNDFGEIGYGGPEPPSGSGVHDYEITLYALDVASLALGVNTSEQKLLSAIEGHVLDEASITGTFETQ